MVAATPIGVSKPETSPLRVRRWPMLRAWAFIGAIAASATIVWLWVLASFGAVEAPASIPWWMLTVLVMVAESAVIHITFREDTHSFSLSEIALVVGLFLASPGALVAAQLLGNAVSLVVGRRQVPIKAAFNVSQIALVTGLATVVFHVIVNPADPLGVAGWLAAVTASTVAIVAGELAINTIIRLTGGNMSRREMLGTMMFGSVGAALNTALGLIAVFVAWHDLRSVWLAGVPPLLMYVAYRVHATQRTQHRHLESIHAFTEAIHTAPDLATALVDAASSARELVGADWLEIVVFRDEGPQPYRTLIQRDGVRHAMAPCALVDELPTWWQPVIGDAASTVVHKASWSAVDQSPPMRKDAIVAPIVGAERLHGYVLAADRLGDVSAFENDDVQLLETVARQVSVALDNGRLETSLATVTALKERLEELVISKDQFVASVSHELRTPLTAVVGFAGELDRNLETFERDDLREFVSLIARESGTLSNIIEDLLVAARADIGTLAIHPVAIDVRQSIDDLLTLGLRSPEASSVVVTGEPVEAWVDPLRFSQVVRNLLTNAQRYGGENVAVEIEQHGAVATIAVVDDGPGVSQDRERAIFEPYERGHEQPSQPGSVGLGLAVSRQLARLMGGDLVYRRDRSLTRFEFTVPARIDA